MPWFKCRAAGPTKAEIVIFDEIGKGGVGAEAVRDALQRLGAVSRIVVSINSPGGDVFDAFAIYNMLRSHAARVEVRIEGVAASAASLIAMAGDEVIMPENALMMIHDPATVSIGNAGEMREAARFLDKVKAGMVSAYASKSGKSRSDIEAIMQAETWLTAEEAVLEGFADRVEEPARIAAVHDLSRYRHPPAPTTMDALAQSYWGSGGKAEVAEELDPTAIYARFNASGKKRPQSKPRAGTSVAGVRSPAPLWEEEEAE